MRLEVTGTHQGFDYKVIVMLMGYRCGYVRLPEGHPWHGKSFHYIDVVVHGGLTFSEMIDNSHSILENGYWIGFDCMHAGDIPDPDEMSKEFRKLGGYRMVKSFSKFFFTDISPRIRNARYVESHCRNICNACAELREIQESFDSNFSSSVESH